MYLSLALFKGFLQVNEAELACTNLPDSGRADIMQQTIQNEVQNTYTNILDDGISCMECTLKVNTETLLMRELLTTASEVSSSGSPSNSTDGVLNNNEQKALQPETRVGILLNAEQSTGRCHMKETKDAHSSEILFRALHDKKICQIKRKRQDLKDTNSKSGLYFSIYTEKSPYSFQKVQNTWKETTQEKSAIFYFKIVILSIVCKHSMYFI